MLDAVVIGAGAAGLAATRTLVEHGFSVQAIEARDRVGGRAHTDAQTYGVPYDRGCAWLHSADINPFRRIAAELGFTVRERDATWRGRIGNLTPAEIEAVNRGIEAGFESIDAAGAAGRDVAATAVLPPAGPGRRELDAILPWVTGVDTPEVSTLDHFLYRDTGRNWPVMEGYGALVAAYGAGLPVRLSTPATAIDWRGPGVKVATPAGDLEARLAIVTVSDRRAGRGAARILAGAAARQADRHREPAAGDRRQGRVPRHRRSFRPAGGQLCHRPCTVQAARPASKSAPSAATSSSATSAAAMPASWRRAASSWPRGRRPWSISSAPRCGKHLSQPAATGWHLDPFARGAYSAARPGHAHRRADLAAPLGDRLFFAGEACSLDFFSTCHGAHLSGIDAALAAAQILAPGPRPASARGA